jgi:hypothetical protein
LIHFCYKKKVPTARILLPPLNNQTTRAFLNTFWDFGTNDSRVLSAGTATVIIRFMSFVAIQVLINRHADAMSAVDGEQGLLPFHFAANWGASLDVIFTCSNIAPRRCVMLGEMLLLLCRSVSCVCRGRREPLLDDGIYL